MLPRIAQWDSGCVRKQRCGCGCEYSEKVKAYARRRRVLDARVSVSGNVDEGVWKKWREVEA